MQVGKRGAGGRGVVVRAGEGCIHAVLQIRKYARGPMARAPAPTLAGFQCWSWSNCPVMPEAGVELAVELVGLDAPKLTFPSRCCETHTVNEAGGSPCPRARICLAVSTHTAGGAGGLRAPRAVPHSPRGSPRRFSGRRADEGGEAQGKAVPHERRIRCSTSNVELVCPYPYASCTRTLVALATCLSLRAHRRRWCSQTSMSAAKTAAHLAPLLQVSTKYGGARNALVLNGRFVMEQLQVGGQSCGRAARVVYGGVLGSPLTKSFSSHKTASSWSSFMGAPDGGRGGGSKACVMYGGRLPSAHASRPAGYGIAREALGSPE